MPRKKKARSERELVDQCNELARLFYKAHGYDTPAGYEFHKADHPRERGMWNLAVIAYDHIEGTDIEDALTALDEG